MSQALVKTPYTPPEERGLAWGVIHWWRNFVGVWPLVLLLIAGVLLTPIPFVVSPDNLGKKVGYGMFRVWSRWLLRGFGVRVWVKGLEHAVADGRYVAVSNHRSHLDVPALGVTLPMHMVTVHKRELEYVPFLGQALWMSRSIGLDRSDKAGAQRRLMLVAQRLRVGRSVMIFPEGRRSRGPRLDPFKKGAFLIAIEQQCPMLPVTIVGTDALYAPGKVMVRRGDVLVTVHPPIQTAGLAMADRDALIRRVHDVVNGAFVAGPVSASMLEGATRLV
ncbi:MAG: 1-acyl-sn-glycerol-3-phosphate acyltransferase [Deltaproteobacteria bacterium]|nr:1-acyl-sn-glycerol-3-phosphate acyltransferase [Deltaproteobacteria bacterium]